MNENKTTKRALGSSIVALLVCFTMLLGSTYAWFTDVVTSSGNVIKTGTLDVAFTWSDDASAAEDTWNDVEAVGAKPIFDYELWEPGYTSVRYLKVENKGTLALKYKLQIVVHNETVNGTDVKLSDVIDVYYAPSKVDVPDRDLDNNPNLTKLGTLTQFLTGAAVNDVLEEKGDADYATLVLKMQESAGNEYQNLSIGTAFDVMLFATQYTYEEDSFDHLYDEDAEFPKFGTGSAAIPTDLPVTAGIDVEVRNEDGYKVASLNASKASFVDGTTEMQVIITESNYNPNITIVAGSESETVDIKVIGLKDGNTAPIKVEYRLPSGLDPSTVKVYHYDTEIVGIDDIPMYDTTYDPYTGYVTFYTTSFSPFTVVYDKDSTYVPPVAPFDELPKANVVNSPEYENVDLPWGKYGSWAPTEGLDSQLESAFTFSCAQTADEAKNSPYANWYCDFYVMLDKDLAANQIFLGGNYGSFGWVGFHNGDLTLEANNEIPLLGSVTTNPWSYADVASYVGTFICGVGDVDDALAGATFTVMLRLTNPDDTTEFYNVAVIEHVFKAPDLITSADELAAAMQAGGDYKLANDITLDVTDTGFTVPKDTSVRLDLNGYDIISTSTSSEGVQLFSVNGNLNVVGEGTISLTNDNFAWTESYRYTAINIRESGEVTLGGDVEVVCEAGSATEKGYGMAYAVDIYKTGTLNVYNASLHSNYIAVRCFYGASVVNVNGGSITSSRNNYGIWPQESPDAVITVADGIAYTIGDFGIYIFN